MSFIYKNNSKFSFWEKLLLFFLPICYNLIKDYVWKGEHIMRDDKEQISSNEIPTENTEVENEVIEDE